LLSSRFQFENIPKPTFNRVDLLEVEILDDTSEPRRFNESIVKLREQMVQNDSGSNILNVKFALDDMKRIVLSTRRYVYTSLGDAFRVGIALPEDYGLMVVNIKNTANYERGLLKTKNWAVHPDWYSRIRYNYKQIYLDLFRIYCNDDSGKEPEEVVRCCLLRKHTSTNFKSSSGTKT
jgi:hypothetical protein